MQKMPKLASIVILTLAVVLFFFAIAGNHGLLQLLRVEAEVESLSKQNRDLESEIVSLNNQIHSIKTSDEVLEKTAREELGLSKRGEIVYIFPENSREKQSRQ